MQTTFRQTHFGKGIKKYKPTDVASPESTGGAGYLFERQVQALFAVLMLCDGELAIAPCKKIVKVQFQTRKNGYHIDDARLELSDGDGSISQILVQIKRAVEFRPSCEDFTDTIQAAWLDFRNKGKFNPNTDMTVLVTGPLRDKDRGVLDGLLEYAQTHSTAAVVAEMQTNAGISLDKCNLFELITNIVRLQDADCTKEDVASFLRCLRIFFPDTVYGEGLLASFAISLLKKHFADVCPAQTFKSLVEIVGEYNAIGGELTKEKLQEKILLLDSRAVLATELKEVAQPKSVINSTSKILKSFGLRQDHLALLSIVGSWNDSMPNDREIVCKCLGMASDALDDFIEPLEQSDPPFIVAEAGVVRVRRRREIWRQTASAVSQKEAVRLMDIAVQQLSREDKSLEFESEEQFVLSDAGDGDNASRVLREGFVQGMALFSADIRYCQQISFDDKQALPVKIVRKILGGRDWKIWATLDDLLPYLAEVSPTEYLAQVSRFVRRKNGGLACLYGQERRGALGRTYILGLVNSLSILAWFPEWIAESLRVLGEMAKLDPSGQWHPRPIDVFQKVLHPLAPHTWASAKRRVEIASALVNRLDRRVAWDVMSRLLPGGFFSYVKEDVGPLYHGEGRLADVEKMREPDGGRWEFDRYCILAVPLAGKDPERLRVIGNNALRCWSDAAFNCFIEHLRKIRSGISGDARYAVWRSICRTLDFVRLDDEKKSNVDWNHPRLKAYCLLEKEFEPEDDRYRALLLFSWEDVRRRQKTTDADRANAIWRIYQRYGIDEIFDFVRKSERPGIVGEAFGLRGNSDTDQLLLPGRLGVEESEIRSFVSGYVRERFHVGGWLWAEEIITHSWTQEQISMLLSMLPFVRDTWGHVTILLHGAEELYWRKVRCPYVGNEQDLQTALDGLLSSGCGYIALDLVGHHLMQDHKIPTALSLKILQAFVANNVIDTPTSMSGYSLSYVIKDVQGDENIATSEKAAIEWYFIDSVDWIGDQGFRPDALEMELMANPQFFCEALKIAYLPTKQAKRIKDELQTNPHSEHELRRIRNVWKLLYNCRHIPGITKDGDFNDKQFAMWIRKVFSLARKEDRLNSAKNIIARTLIYAPKDSNGFWMPHVVADLLEKSGNETMLTHYRIALFNSRGVHVVDKTGREDRELAGKYIAMAEDAERRGYFGLAREMRSLASSIQDDAARMQEDDKIREAHYAAKREARDGK